MLYEKIKIHYLKNHINRALTALQIYQKLYFFKKTLFSIFISR